MFEQRAALEYPNGRRHMCTVTSKHELAAGAEFDMFARTWRVSHIHADRTRGSDQTYLVCRTIGKPTAPPARGS
jgi:hypothetical protein